MCLLILSGWLLCSQQPAIDDKDICERIEEAASLVEGVPYKWGAYSLVQGGFDCSGFIYYIQKAIGRPVPRTTAKRYYYMASSSQKSKSIEDEKCGAWVWWTLTPDRPFGHIGVAVDNNYVWHSGSSTGPIKISLDNPFWNEKLVDIR